MVISPNGLDDGCELSPSSAVVGHCGVSRNRAWSQYVCYGQPLAPGPTVISEVSSDKVYLSRCPHRISAFAVMISVQRKTLSRKRKNKVECDVFSCSEPRQTSAGWILQMSFLTRYLFGY